MAVEKNLYVKSSTDKTGKCRYLQNFVRAGLVYSICRTSNSWFIETTTKKAKIDSLCSDISSLYEQSETFFWALYKNKQNWKNYEKNVSDCSETKTKMNEEHDISPLRILITRDLFTQKKTATKIFSFLHRRQNVSTSFLFVCARVDKSETIVETTFASIMKPNHNSM